MSEAMFVSGAMNNDYGFMFNGKMTKTDNYTATGISNTVLASRLSYVFNLTGPCMVLDTACSSGIVAIHMGCMAILSGELLGGGPHLLLYTAELTGHHQRGVLGVGLSLTSVH